MTVVKIEPKVTATAIAKSNIKYSQRVFITHE